MRILSTITLIILLIMGMFIVTYKEQEGTTLEGLQRNLTTVRSIDTIFNESFAYKNPYQTNFTFNDFVINTAHVIAYPLIMELHTTIGAGTNFMWNYATLKGMKALFRIFLIGFVLWLVFNSIKPIGIIYVIITEHYEKKKEKK